MAGKSPENRGRVQAQGPDTEESEAWPPPDTPLTKDQVLDMLDRVWDKLSKQEREDREGCFEDARGWVQSRPKVGVDAVCMKTFQNRKMRRGVRVDIDVLVGKACVDDAPNADDDTESTGID